MEEIKQIYILHNFQHGVEYVYLDKPTVVELAKRFYSYEYDPDTRMKKAQQLLDGMDTDWRYSMPVENDDETLYLYTANVLPHENGEYDEGY